MIIFAPTGFIKQKTYVQNGENILTLQAAGKPLLQSCPQ